ncbi:MAG: SGNH/GDSL hydrolase family protein [Cyclobacteriaceae bacterium]
MRVFLLAMIVMSAEVTFGQDWPNLSKFKEANDTLGAPAKGENRVVFMGNSITEGWKDHHPEFFANKSFINRGIGGQTTPQMLIRFRQDVVNLKPGVVVILAGTNDIAGNTGPSTLDMIYDNIVSMAEIAQANGIKVIISSVLPAFDYPWRPGLDPATKIPALNKMLSGYATENGLTYLDYFSAMTDGNNGLRKELTYDGVHPNRAGYEVMASLALKAIDQVLSR